MLAALSHGMNMNLEWNKFTFENLENALSKRYCLYVFPHPDDNDRPFYIGKAKYFGQKKTMDTKVVLDTMLDTIIYYLGLSDQALNYTFQR